MDRKKYEDDLKDIKEIMSRTTQFLSLSGLSGVSTGIIALAGVFAAYKFIFEGQEYMTLDAVIISHESLWRLLLIAFITLVTSIISAVFFTGRKTREQFQSTLDFQTKRLLINLLIPLTTGGIICLMLLFKGFVGFLPAMTLIFYGLGLVNGSKYTIPEIKTLGIIQILIGLCAFHFINYGLIFWAVGFGIVQITYGIIIQRKY